MTKRFRRMSENDITTILADLDRWALGHLGSKLTWALLEERFGFSRQSLQAKPEIKAGYDIAKQSLSGGLVKTKEQATQENDQLLLEIARLKTELEAYKNKEQLWMRKWQQIAFHVRQKGIQISNMDTRAPETGLMPSYTETVQILKPFDSKIPSTGQA